MELLNLPRLRMKELQTVSESSVRICDTITEVKPLVDKVKACLDDFKQSMQKVKVSAADKALLDKERDNFITGFFYNIKAESYLPLDGTTAEVSAALMRIVDKYSGINRYNYNAQTAATDNMLDEAKKLDLQEGDTPIIGRWLPLIEQANNKFKAANEAYIQGNAIISKTEAAYEMAPQLAENLQELYTVMFAYGKIGTNEAIVKAYSELEVLIKSVN